MNRYSAHTALMSCPFGWHRDELEDITDESLESNRSIIEKIPPKGESFSDFFATFDMSVGFDTCFDLQH